MKEQQPSHKKHNCWSRKFLLSEDQIIKIDEDNSYRFYKYHKAHNVRLEGRKFLTKSQHWEIVDWFWRRISDDIVSNEGGVVLPYIGYICNVIRGGKSDLAKKFLRRDDFFYFPFGLPHYAYAFYYFKASKQLYSRILAMRKHGIKYKMMSEEALVHADRDRPYVNRSVRPVLDMRAYYGREEAKEAKKWLEGLKNEY